MGSLAARDMAAHAPLAQAVAWHLSSNHYPPVPSCMVGPCVRAIRKARRGDWESRIRLPKGVKYQGRALAPVSAVMDGHHLHDLM
jgi:hypothetical protein